MTGYILRTENETEPLGILIETPLTLPTPLVTSLEIQGRRREEEL